jgi:hypothetical protein
MSVEALLIRFPDGGTEYFSGSVVPSTGDRLTRRNSEWIVGRVDLARTGRAVVSVRPAAVRCDESWPKPYELIRLPLTPDGHRLLDDRSVHARQAVCTADLARLPAAGRESADHPATGAKSFLGEGVPSRPLAPMPRAICKN